MADIERRTMLQAAWAAPLVVLAVGTPAAAASTVPGITVAWLLNGSSYQVIYTNNTGGVIPATTAVVALTAYRGVTNVVFNASEWTTYAGQQLTVMSLLDLADGVSSIVFSSVTVGPPPVNAIVEAYSDDYYNSATLDL